MGLEVRANFYFVVDRNFGFVVNALLLYFDFFGLLEGEEEYAAVHVVIRNNLLVDEQRRMGECAQRCIQERGLLELPVEVGNTVALVAQSCRQVSQ